MNFAVFLFLISVGLPSVFAVPSLAPHNHHSVRPSINTISIHGLTDTATRIPPTTVRDKPVPQDNPSQDLCLASIKEQDGLFAILAGAMKTWSTTRREVDTSRILSRTKKELTDDTTASLRALTAARTTLDELIVGQIVKISKAEARSERTRGKSNASQMRLEDARDAVGAARNVVKEAKLGVKRAMSDLEAVRNIGGDLFRAAEQLVARAEKRARKRIAAKARADALVTRLEELVDENGFKADGADAKLANLQSDLRDLEERHITSVASIVTAEDSNDTALAALAECNHELLQSIDAEGSAFTAFGKANDAYSAFEKVLCPLPGHSASSRAVSKYT